MRWGAMSGVAGWLERESSGPARTWGIDVTCRSESHGIGDRQPSRMF